MRKLAVAVRADRAAGMQVRINHGSERRCALDRRIEAELQLPRERKIRPEARRADYLVNCDAPPPVRDGHERTFGALRKRVEFRQVAS